MSNNPSVTFPTDLSTPTHPTDRPKSRVQSVGCATVVGREALGPSEDQGAFLHLGRWKNHEGKTMVYHPREWL